MTIRPVAAPAAGCVAGAGRCHVAQRGEDLHVWLLPDKIVGLARSARAGMCNPCGFQLYLSGVGAGCPSRVFPLIAGFTCQCLADRRGQRLLWHRTVTFAGRRKKSHLRQGWQVQKKCFAQKKKEKMGKHRREGEAQPPPEFLCPLASATQSRRNQLAPLFPSGSFSSRYTSPSCLEASVHSKGTSPLQRGLFHPLDLIFLIGKSTQVLWFEEWDRPQHAAPIVPLGLGAARAALGLCLRASLPFVSLHDKHGVEEGI